MGAVVSEVAKTVVVHLSLAYTFVLGGGHCCGLVAGSEVAYHHTIANKFGRSVTTQFLSSSHRCCHYLWCCDFISQILTKVGGGGSEESKLLSKLPGQRGLVVVPILGSEEKGGAIAPTGRKV